MYFRVTVCNHPKLFIFKRLFSHQNCHCRQGVEFINVFFPKKKNDFFKDIFSIKKVWLIYLKKTPEYDQLRHTYKILGYIQSVSYPLQYTTGKILHVVKQTTLKM